MLPLNLGQNIYLCNLSSNTLVNAWFQVASISIYFSFIRKVLPFEGVELVIVWFS